MGRATLNFIFGPAPWCTGEGSKGQISFNFNHKVNFKDFMQNFVCVLTNERYKTYQTRFSFCPLGHAQGWDFGALGCPGVSFFQTWSCGISKNGDDEQSRMQVNFSS